MRREAGEGTEKSEHGDDEEKKTKDRRTTRMYLRKCRICGWSSTSQKDLDEHKVFSFSSFSLFFSFLSHKVVHNQMDRTVKCEQCSMIFFDQRDLRAHEKAAHKLDFHCVYCDKQFRMATYLEKHLEKHKLLMEK